MTLPPFDHAAADSLEEAAGLLQDGRAAVIAGGTDLLGSLKDRIHPESPTLLVDIKTSIESSYVVDAGSSIRVGALTTLGDLADNDVVNERVPLLAEAARAVGSPQLRNMATVGGNICQEPRCWYYRAPDNAFYCMRKGGTQCAALLGDNRYHSIFGAARPVSAPCTTSCPAHIEIPRYLEKIREGDWRAAARLVLEHNPMPAVTGRVCPHFCEVSCNRCELEGAVSTRAVERYLGDQVLAEASEFYRPPEVLTNKRVAIVGSGPAGLAAAYYLRAAGHDVTVFDAMSEVGGMLTHSIPRYRLPREVVDELAMAFENMGVKFVLGATMDGEGLRGLRRDFDSVFVATGAWRDRFIAIDGAEQLQSGLEFLMSVQTRQHAPGDQVLVIGGGGVAVDVAVSARRFGAAHVTMVCLESRDTMPASPEEIEEALNEGVELLTSWGPQRVLTHEGRVSGIQLVRCRSVFDEEGHFAPSYDRDTTLVVDADCILLAIGQVPDLRYAEGVFDVNGGRIATEQSGATSLRGVYAGGDAVSGPASVIEAIASGRRAAIAIDGSLGGTAGGLSNDGVVPSSLLSVRVGSLGPLPRVPVFNSSPSTRDLEREDVGTLDLESVCQEAERCMNCACVAVNASDLAPALVALGARIRTTKRVVDAGSFFGVGKASTTILEADELVAEVEVPVPSPASTQRYRKFRLRHSIDFPIVSVASVLSIQDNKIDKASVVLGAVAPIPLHAGEVESFLVGREPDRGTAEAAGVIAVKNARPLDHNAFKAQIVRALLREAVLEVGDSALQRV